METTPCTAPLAALRGRHLVFDADFTPDEIRSLMRLAVDLKALRKRRRFTPFLAGHHLAMIYEVASTRTRVSFENGFEELGGNAVYLRPGEIHMPGRETIADTAQTLSRLCDAIQIRAKSHETIVELARHATVPVINGMDGISHPCQAMSDMLTIFECAGDLDGLKLAFIGDASEASNVCSSVSFTACRMGIDVKVVTPPWSGPVPDWWAETERAARGAGSHFDVVHDPVDGTSDADFIYTDCWWWTGDEDKRDAIVERFLPYQVNAALVARAKPGTRFMHCLPAMRGEEVTDEVADSEASIMFPQAENRMHFQKALLLGLIGIDELPKDPDLQDIGRALLK